MPYYVVANPSAVPRPRYPEYHVPSPQERAAEKAERAKINKIRLRKDHKTLREYLAPYGWRAEEQDEPEVPETWRPDPALLKPHQRLQNLFHGGDSILVYGHLDRSNSDYHVSNGAKPEAVWHELKTTMKAHRAVKEVASWVDDIFPDTVDIPLVPNVKGWVHKSDLASWWTKHKEHFQHPDVDCPDEHIEDDDNIPRAVFATSSIPSIGLPGRKALSNQYNLAPVFIDGKIPARRLFPENEHYLVRPCFGMANRQAFKGKDEPKTFNTFPLTTPDFIRWTVKYEGIDRLSREMGVGLAVLHWGAAIDARGVKFLLGNYHGFDDAAAINLFEDDLDAVEPFDILSPAPLHPLSILEPGQPEFDQDDQEDKAITRRSRLYLTSFSDAKPLRFADKDPASLVMHLQDCYAEDQLPCVAGWVGARPSMWEAFSDGYLKTAEKLMNPLAEKHGDWVQNLHQDFIKTRKDWLIRRVELKRSKEEEGRKRERDDEANEEGSDTADRKIIPLEGSEGISWVRVFPNRYGL